MSPDREVRIAALLSIGLHPTSGRARSAAQDARAVELGLRLAGQAVRLLHVGGEDEETLRRYLGMGAPRVDVLPATGEDDAVAPLVNHFQGRVSCPYDARGTPSLHLGKCFLRTAACALALAM